MVVLTGNKHNHANATNTPLAASKPTVVNEQIVGLCALQSHAVMTHTIKVFFKHLALASLMACCALANAQTLVGKVVGVIDGDTIDVLDDTKIVHRIRLAGIDAPEKAQPFGQRSKEHLSNIVFGKRVEVIGNKVDRYGRTVGKIEVGGIDANLEQVKAGFAWHYKEYAREQLAEDRDRYASAEASARVNRTGLWRDNKQIPPWEWRRGGKNISTLKSASTGCSCDSKIVCTGKRGDQYCITPQGKKKYY